MRVVVVEDHEDLAHLLVEQLTHEGLEVVSYTENFERLLSPRPWENVDAAVVDYWLRPGAFLPDDPEGYPILEYLRDSHPHIRRVIYSAIGAESVPDGLAHVVLTKPAHVDKLLEAIRG